MEAEMLRTMCDYGDWAMEKVFVAAEGLTQEQLDAPGTAGRGSIRETLVHLIRAHKSWLSWWDGSMSSDDSSNLSLDAKDYPNIDAIRTLWADVSRQTAAFTSSLQDADVVRVYTDTDEDGEMESLILWHMMVHVVNHGTQHRSEVAAMLTDFGHSPGNLDMIFYFLEQPGDGSK